MPTLTERTNALRTECGSEAGAHRRAVGELISVWASTMGCTLCAYERAGCIPDVYLCALTLPNNPEAANAWVLQVTERPDLGGNVVDVLTRPRPGEVVSAAAAKACASGWPQYWSPQ